jgi:hypothetical protein
MPLLTSRDRVLAAIGRRNYTEASGIADAHGRAVVGAMIRAVRSASITANSGAPGAIDHREEGLAQIALVDYINHVWGD